MNSFVIAGLCSVTLPSRLRACVSFYPCIVFGNVYPATLHSHLSYRTCRRPLWVGAGFLQLPMVNSSTPLLFWCQIAIISFPSGSYPLAPR